MIGNTELSRVPHSLVEASQAIVREGTPFEVFNSPATLAYQVMVVSGELLAQFIALPAVG